MGPEINFWGPKLGGRGTRPIKKKKFTKIKNKNKRYKVRINIK